MSRALARYRMVGSMGRVGSSGDNAAMESFFALLQKNVLDRSSWTTREQLRIAIVTLNRPGFRGGSVTWNRPLLGLVFQGSARG
jgi:transposase InsO family protein